MSQGTIFRTKGVIPYDDFRLEDPSTDNEIDPLMLQHPKKPKKHIVHTKPMSIAEKQLWYLRWILLTLVAILGVMIGVLVATLIAVPVITNSQQFSRVVNLVDRVHDMADITTNSQAQISEAMATYNVPHMVESVKTLVNQGAALVGGLSPETLQSASDTASKFAESLQKLDFEQAKALMAHANEWSNTIDPNKISASLDEVQAFLKKGNEAMKTAQDTNLIQHIGEFAAGGVELESRLKRLNEITIKLP